MKSIELNVFTNSTISSPSTEMIENTVLSFNKIFGNNTTEALNLVKTGISKEELLEKTNCVLGLNDINLDIP